MTGMKEGAGSDPFATDPTPSPTDESDTETEDRETDEQDETESEPSTDTMIETTTQHAEIPMILRRDSVQDGRDRVPLFLQQDTKRDEREALRELENRFDGDVSLTDLREALLLAGLSDLDSVEKTLRDWGYGLSFD